MGKARNISKAESRFVNATGDTITGNITAEGYVYNTLDVGTTEPLCQHVIGDPSDQFAGVGLNASMQNHFRFLDNGDPKWQIRHRVADDQLRVFSWTKGDDVQEFLSNGSIKFPTQPSWRVSLASNTEFTAGQEVKIPWSSTQERGHLVGCTLSSGRITVPTSGRYYFSVVLRTEATAMGPTDIYVKVNGTRVNRWYQEANTVSRYHHYGPIVGVVNVSANDYFEVYVSPGTTGVFSGGSNTVCFFSGYLLG
jgi:hypothetical protein